MRKHYLKIIVAVWAFFISFDQVFAFFATMNGPFDWSSPIPYLAVILFVSGILIFIPGLKKLDYLLIALISVIFGFFAVTGTIAFIQNMPVISSANDVMPFLASLTNALKGVFFNIVPAVLGIIYLIGK